MTGSASTGRLARLSRRTTGQRIGRFSVEAAQLFGGFYHLLIGRSALGGDFGSIEGQLQIDLRTQPGTAAGRRRLQINPGFPLVQQVDSLVEGDLADVEPQLPQTAFGLLEVKPHGLRHECRNGTALPDVKGDAAARFELYAAFLRDPLAVGVLFEHVIGRQVGTIDDLFDPQAGHFEHVLGLAQRTAGDIGHRHHLLSVGVDRDIDRSSGFDPDALFRELVQYYTPVVGRHIQRVVDDDFQPLTAGLPESLLERNACQVGDRTVRTVARAQQQQQVSCDAQHEQHADDDEKVFQERMLTDFRPIFFQLFQHGIVLSFMFGGSALSGGYGPIRFVCFR